MLISALTPGRCILTNALRSLDTQVMAQALEALGVPLSWEKSLVIEGQGGRFPCPNAKIQLQDCGTTARFLTALLSVTPGSFFLNGSKRLQERPTKPLFDALQDGTERFTYHGDEKKLPVTIQGKPFLKSQISVEAAESSQFPSGIALTLPFAPHCRTLKLLGPTSSRDYLEMTLALMRSFGASISFTDKHTILCDHRFSYQARDFEIETDLSSASYFGALAAIHSGEVTIAKISKDTLQSEKEFFTQLEKMGCGLIWKQNHLILTGPQKLRAVDADMNQASDSAMTLAVTCLFADQPSRIYNVAHIRKKECDRIFVLARELRKIGANIDELPDGWVIHPLERYAFPESIEIDPENDHRIAMSLAVVGTKIPKITITQAECVEKSFPEFFNILQVKKTTHA